MTTYTEFYNNLKALSVANVKTVYDSEPDFLERNDLPAMWVQEPEGEEAPITFQRHGGWPTFAAVVVIAIEHTSKMERKRATEESLMFMDNLATALRGAGQTIAKSRITWTVRKGVATMGDLDFWAVQAEVLTHG
jgi:hypothetical protein